MSEEPTRVPATSASDPSRAASPSTAQTAAVPSVGPDCTASAPSSPPPLSGPRLRRPDRQVLIPAMPLENLVEPDHDVRKVWRFVAGLDLAVLYNAIRARDSRPGRPPIDPRLLVALWLYAIYSGVVSARQLALLCREHNAYRWLCGGISVNHHSLSDFLVEHGDFLEQLLRHSVEALRRLGLVPLERVAQDGMRVRASAGAASFHRQATLEQQLEEARAEVQRLQEALRAGLVPTPATGQTHEPEVAAEEEDRQGPSGPEQGQASAAAQEKAKRSRHQAAAARAAGQRQARAEQALLRLPEIEARKKADDKAKARVSSTDAEATVMKMANGGFNPAYNIHFCTDVDSLVVVGVEVIQSGSDQGQLKPMLAQVQERFGQRPKEAEVDGGFVKLEEIEEIQKGEEGQAGTLVYAPVPQPKDEKRDRYAALPSDSPQVAEWRQRMGTDQAKEIYKQRAQTAECVNAQARNRGLIRLLVRGVQKVKAVATWFAAVHNMARGFVLLSEPAAAPGVT